MAYESKRANIPFEFEKDKAARERAVADEKAANDARVKQLEATKERLKREQREREERKAKEEKEKAEKAAAEAKAKAEKEAAEKAAAAEAAKPQMAGTQQRAMDLISMGNFTRRLSFWERHRLRKIEAAADKLRRRLASAFSRDANNDYVCEAYDSLAHIEVAARLEMLRFDAEEVEKNQIER